jgi:hypothetical protein
MSPHAQYETWTRRGFCEPRKMSRHSPPVLADEHAPRIRCDLRTCVSANRESYGVGTADGDLGRNAPHTPQHAPSRSASAWNLTRTAGALEPGDQLCVRFFRLTVQGLGRAMSRIKMRVNVDLISAIKKPAHRAPARASARDSSPRTFLRGRGKRASRATTSVADPVNTLDHSHVFRHSELFSQ